MTVGCTNHDDLSATLDTIHESKELSDDTFFDFSLSFVTVGSNRVDLINEKDGRRILVALFEGTSQIRLGLTLLL